MPIFTSARAMPMVRTNSFMRCFCPAKTCSTAERTADLANKKAAVNSGQANVERLEARIERLARSHNSSDNA